SARGNRAANIREFSTTKKQCARQLIAPSAHLPILLFPNWHTLPEKSRIVTSAATGRDDVRSRCCHGWGLLNRTCRVTCPPCEHHRRGAIMTRTLNQPLGGNQMPRFGGPATMMRLPSQTGTDGLDACFVGIPMDIGASNRAGTRYGPRQIRA